MKCEACGMSSAGPDRFKYVHTVNGGLCLCQPCLDEINGKNPEAARLREIIRYWSYCTYNGMRRECPEKEPEFREVCRSLGIQPYDSTPAERKRDDMRSYTECGG